MCTCYFRDTTLFQVLVTALLDTIKKWVINILLLLLLMMFLFAIMGYYFFGYRDDASDKEHWGSLVHDVPAHRHGRVVMRRRWPARVGTITPHPQPEPGELGTGGVQ